MGAIKEAVNNVTNSPNELKETHKDIINLLDETARIKGAQFEAEIEKDLIESGSDTNKKVPIESVIHTESFTHAFSGTNYENIEQTAVDSFALLTGEKTNVAKGIGKIIGGIAKSLLVTTSSETVSKEKYFVFPVGVSLLRVDVKMWSRKIEINSFSQVIEKIFVASAAISIVDLTKIGLSTIIYFYQSQLNETDLTVEEKKEAIEELKELHFIINKESTNKNNRLLSL